MLIITHVTIQYRQEKMESAIVYFTASSNTSTNFNGSVLIPPSEYTGADDIQTLKPLVIQKIKQVIEE